MKTPPLNVAFWLQPAARERKFFASLIRQLGERCDAPVFEPHLTLQGGQMPLARAREILQGISAPALLQLEIERIAFSEAYTKTVFLQFRPSAEASALSGALAAEPETSRSYHFDPHLSLIYKEMPLPEKEALARAIEIPSSQVTFDSLKLIACPADIRERRDVEAWRVLGERALLADPV